MRLSSDEILENDGTDAFVVGAHTKMSESYKIFLSIRALRLDGRMLIGMSLMSWTTLDVH